MKQQRRSRKEIKKDTERRYGDMAEHKPKVQAIRIMRTKPYETIDVSAYHLKKKE